ncbi:MAG: bifunctional phosphoribosylaminoimidazolecarboxamide formyltransferase/IMP cyclohydrolase PurH [Chitinophagaceae bacterium]|nr:MAG: bifunctional phosphoribosylaminoimidazolecarboxamide formyltransferase/IMP cyclohydrolase PurH [Chitinophagaceae bacterium]
MKKIKSALVSVFHKEGLDEILKCLNENKVKIYSTGGTQKFIESKSIEVHAVEDLTEYPSILGGRVKTLHPKIFGGILARRSEKNDVETLEEYNIPEIDLVIVDLYPFEDTVKSGAENKEIIEKIDIGGISLIRAAAKNYEDTAIISDKSQYQKLASFLKNQEGALTIEQRKEFALEAFFKSSEYDRHIFNYFNENKKEVFQRTFQPSSTLRYGENPHQKGVFYGKMDTLWEQLHGKQLSYNNLLDIDNALAFSKEFSEPAAVIVKHNNACGLATESSIQKAYEKALEGDPVSAFGGVIVLNRTVDKNLAEIINTLFLEVLIAPEYEKEALEILKSKKNRILLRLKNYPESEDQFRSALGGVLWQEKDNFDITENTFKKVTNQSPSEQEVKDLIFAQKVVKHLKSNAIVLVRNNQLLGSGCGQTSRVDALKQAIAKAREFGLDLKGAVMASDAFFPFSDSVEIAAEEGIKAVIQPGGSVRDQETIDVCNQHSLSMVFTGIRHFKH